MRQVGYEISPGLAFGWGHEFPPLRVLQELLAFCRAQIRESLKGPKTLGALGGRKTAERAQSFLDLESFGVRKHAQGFVLLRRCQVEKLIETSHYRLTLLIGQCLPSPDTRLLLFKICRRRVLEPLRPLFGCACSQFEIKPHGGLVF